MSDVREQIQRDLEEFSAKALPGESWDVYLVRMALERALASPAPEVREP